MKREQKFGFPNSFRLKTEDSTKVFKFSQFKIYYKKLLTLACTNQVGHFRVGLIFSKKTTRSAVDRNYLKRFTREYIRLRQEKIPAIDIVVLSIGRIHEISETLNNLKVLLRYLENV